MRLSIIGNILGGLLIFIAITMLWPFGWALYYQEPDALVFVISAVITMLSGLFMRFFCDDKSELTMKESFAVVTLGWILAAVFGGLPFLIGGYLPNFFDAFFEAMSGFTTTGASVFTDVEVLPHGILFWRSLTHWFGGMGIIVLFIAILPRIGMSGMQLFRAEVPGPSAERLLPKIKDTARILWLIYVGFTIVQTILLVVAGLPLFDSLIHTFGSVATGGFSSKNLSVGAYNNLAAELIMVFFMFVCGANFALYYQLFKGNPGSLFKDTEFRFYFFVVLCSTIFIALNLLQNDIYTTFGEALRYSLFQVVSIITTTGYATVNFDLWPPFAKFVLLLLMFVGGCAGSTGGAIKNIRIVLLLKQCYREIFKIVHPRAVVPLRVGGKAVPNEIVGNIIGFIFLYLLVFIISSMALMAMGLDIISAISAVAATLGNVGPGLGVVGPVCNYSSLNNLGTFILTICMLLGRLEIYTVLVFILPEFRQRRVFRKIGRNAYQSIMRSFEE